MGALGRTRRRRLRLTRGRRDERGGAISLWVVLMVPVSAFAAVVAMAGPQRLAAESSVQEAAEDLAVFAVAWRDGQQAFAGPLPAFPPECAARTAQQRDDLALLEGRINLLDPTVPPPAHTLADIQRIDDDLWGPSPNPAWGPTGLLGQFEQFGLPVPAAAATNKAELQDQFDAAVAQLDLWDEACELLFEALVRDLGYLGVNMNTLRASYSDSLTRSDLGGGCSDQRYTTQADCTGASETWTTPDPQYYLPCRTSAVTPAGSTTMVHDAVHVVLAANWQDAGWAAAQVWREGIPMAAEATGRFNQRVPSGLTPPPECQAQLVVLDPQGRPVWAGSDPMPASRELAQSVRRATVSG